MIARDQPTIFGADVIAGVSSVDDGNMRFNRGDDNATLRHRRRWFARLGIELDHTTLVQVVYDDTSYERYKIVDESHAGVGMTEPICDIVADALLTRASEHALFLPLADCAGVVLHDPIHQLLMVSHIGRHSAEIDGAAKSVAYMVRHGGDVKAICAWVSPAVGEAAYPLHKCNGQSLHQAIRAQLLSAGITPQNMQFAPTDTSQSTDYYSHSQFKRGLRDFDGRHAIVAMMRGE